MTSRRDQAQETKKRIYEKTIDLLKDHDFEDITVQEICKNAGCSVGNFYNYFSSKEELVIQSYPFFDEYVEDLPKVTEEINPLEAITSLIVDQVKVIDDLGPNIASQCLRVHLKMSGRFLIRSDRPFHQYLLKLVKEAQAREIFSKEKDPVEIASRILRISRGIIFDWSIRGGSYQIIDKVLEDLNIYFSTLE